MHKLAIISGMPYSTLYDIENNNAIPKLITLCKLADALGYEPHDLYEYKR